MTIPCTNHGRFILIPMLIACVLVPSFMVILSGNGAVATTIIPLNVDWTVSTEYQNIRIRNQSLPIGSYSALENNGFTGPVYESFNDVNLRWIAQRNWTFETEFPSPTFTPHAKVILTFLGIDTISSIQLNGNLLGATDNMFVRYQFDVKDLLKGPAEGLNQLRVVIANPIKAASDLAAKNTFTPPNCPPGGYKGECHMNFLRKMQASFAWDWGLAAPSSGIWKDVQLEVYEIATVRESTIVLDLVDHNWHVLFNVHLETGLKSSPVKGELEITIHGIENARVTKSIDNQSDVGGHLSVAVNMVVPAEKVELWWPNGFGNQTLYDVTVSFTQEQQHNGPAKDTKTFRIGFRTINLIQDPIGTGLSFYFKVNGQAIFMKGSNWIPSDILPERGADRRRIKYLLSAARDAHMNMLRVWGGGIYESDFFYELADEYGLLIWQDLMFACAMYPVFPSFLESVRTEVEQNVRRLQHHASIAIYATNNENEVALVQNWYSTKAKDARFRDEYRRLYIEVVKRAVEENDKWRVCLSSSPSNGLKTIDDNYISESPQDPNFGDIHYYDYAADAWNWSIYPRPRFVSEYGFQSYPSYSSWGETLRGNDYLPQMMSHRQHSPLGELPILQLIERHLPLSRVPANQTLPAKIYFSQIAQARAIKTETELYRTLRNSFANTMGALYWQLNDVWVAPSWSSIDYLGKFKILHYHARKFLEPISIVPIVNAANVLEVNVINDVLTPSDKNYTAVMRLFNWKDLNNVELMTWTFEMVPNAVQKLDQVRLWEIFNASVPAAEHFLQFTLANAADQIVSTNFIFPTRLKDAKGVKTAGPNVTIEKSECVAFEQRVTLVIRASAPILFFYVDIMNESVKDYQLSDNGFMVVEPVTQVTITYPNVDCSGTRLTMDDLKVYTVNQYMV